MAAVDAGADETWKVRMEEALTEICKTRRVFTADEVFALAAERWPEIRTRDARAFGPIMMRAAKDGMIEKADVMGMPCNRPSRHGAPLTVWRSLVASP